MGILVSGGVGFSFHFVSSHTLRRLFGFCSIFVSAGLLTVELLALALAVFFFHVFFPPGYHHTSTLGRRRQYVKQNPTWNYFCFLNLYTIYPMKI